jgi:hypothetical protein
MDSVVGPDLFTFDNHDPKGGCVLLNDGTVKFIRTKEEAESGDSIRISEREAG